MLDRCERLAPVRAQRGDQHDWLARRHPADAVNGEQVKQLVFLDRFRGEARDLGIGVAGIMFEFEPLDAVTAAQADKAGASARFCVPSAERIQFLPGRERIGGDAHDHGRNRAMAAMASTTPSARRIAVRSSLATLSPAPATAPNSAPTASSGK